jgi:hypothetical protein
MISRSSADSGFRLGYFKHRISLSRKLDYPVRLNLVRSRDDTS